MIDFASLNEQLGHSVWHVHVEIIGVIGQHPFDCAFLHQAFEVAERGNIGHRSIPFLEVGEAWPDGASAPSSRKVASMSATGRPSASARRRRDRKSKRLNSSH